MTVAEYKNLQKRYRNILTRGEKGLPKIPPKPKDKCGKVMLLLRIIALSVIYRWPIKAIIFDCYSVGTRRRIRG
jgi:hypothetical protein